MSFKMVAKMPVMATDEASHPADNLSFHLGQVTLGLGAEQFNISLQ
jgi:hypothetical protein